MEGIVSATFSTCSSAVGMGNDGDLQIVVALDVLGKLSYST